jgi:hypothetical protein
MYRLRLSGAPDAVPFFAEVALFSLGCGQGLL